MRTFLDFYTIPYPGWPPLNIVTYWLLLGACSICAILRGGPPERLGAAILAISSLLTVATIPSHARFRVLETQILVIDVLCLAALVILALRADRFWPLWVAALQLLGVASHGVKFLEPDLFSRTYAFMLAIWSYPMIALMIAGTLRHHARLLKFGHDRSWSPLRKVT